MKRTLSFIAVYLCLIAPPLRAGSGNQPPTLLSDLVDVSSDFCDYTSGYFLADHLAGFDPAKATGTLVWQRNQLSPRIAFSNMEAVLQPFNGVTFPEGEYAINPELPFSIEFVTPRTAHEPSSRQFAASQCALERAKGIHDEAECHSDNRSRPTLPQAAAR